MKIRFDKMKNEIYVIFHCQCDYFIRIDKEGNSVEFLNSSQCDVIPVVINIDFCNIDKKQFNNKNEIIFMKEL